MKILIAIDQSNFWKQVVDAVGSRIFPSDSEVKILTVLKYAPFDWAEQNSANWKKMAQELMCAQRDLCHEVLKKARQRLTDENANFRVHTELREGDPRDQILSCAAEWMPEKIFVGAHGHSQNRLLSIATPLAVARQAACSVEIVRLMETGSNSNKQRPKRVTSAVR